MLQTDTVRAVQVDAQLGMLKCLLRCHHHCIFFPARRGNVQLLLGKLLTLVHRVLVNQLNADGCLALRSLGPYGKAVLFALLHTNAKVTLVRQTRTTVAVAWVAQLHIVRTALEWSVVLHVDTAEGLPAHQVLRKLKRTVFYQFTIQSTVSGIVDVLEKNTIHSRLDGRT